MSLHPGLFCPTSFSGGGFRSSLLWILLWIGSDYQPRRDALPGEMRVSIALNRRRKGIGGNDEHCNTGFVRSHVLPSFPTVFTSPLLRSFFSWFNTRFDRPSSFRSGPARSRPRIGFSRERTMKRNARKRSFNLFSFQAKTFRFTRAKRFTHV